MTKPLPMKEAQAFWADKVPMTKEQFNALAEEAQARAFFVAGLARLDMVQEVQNALGKALGNGETLSQFKQRIASVAQAQGWTSWRVENIFRTNLQSAYQAGRYKQMVQVAKARPYWRYVSTQDSRTRPEHRALHGRVYHHEHSFWNQFYPPNGFACRCTVQTLSERQVKDRGLKIEKSLPQNEIWADPDTGMERNILPLPDKGWDRNVGKAYWQPDLSEYRPDLKQGFLDGLIDNVCPDDFANTSSSICLARLKKHLKQKDLEDFETLIWARMQGGVEGYEEWAEAVLKRMQAKGELYPVGNLPWKVLEFLKVKGVQPRLALVAMDDKQLLHMVRTAKQVRGQALSAREVMEISERFASCDWYLDNEEEGLLMAWVRIKNSAAKVVIRVDQKVGGAGVANKVITAGIVSQDNLKKKNYEKI